MTRSRETSNVVGALFLPNTHKKHVMGSDKFVSVAKCDECGHEGKRIQKIDDWMRSSTYWEGFDNVPPNPTAIGRMRVSQNDCRPVCQCGSKNISISKEVRA